MEYMFSIGFLGTRAPLFMDLIVIIVGLLPFLIAFNIWFATNMMYKLHRFLNILLFWITITALVYFEYGMSVTGGFNFYIKDSSMDSTIAFYFLIFHVIVATITLVMWFFILRFANADHKRRALPGLYSREHKKSGKRLSFAIFLTSITGIGVYWMLFVV